MNPQATALGAMSSKNELHLDFFGQPFLFENSFFNKSLPNWLQGLAMITKVKQGCRLFY